MDNNAQEKMRWWSYKMDIPMKLCKKCDPQQMKPLSEFHKSKHHSSGVNSCCKSCANKNGKKHYTNNKERTLKNNKIYRSENIQEIKQKKKKYRLKYITREKELKLINKYGMSLEDYAKMLEMCDHVCSICKTHTTKRSLAVDHDHITGEIRGLLCGKCNVILGLCHDNPVILLQAVEYLNSKINYSTKFLY